MDQPAIAMGSSPQPITLLVSEQFDSQTGLLYYTLQYDDPVSGRFVRADTIINNAQGMDPYAYVSIHLETDTGPTGAGSMMCEAIAKGVAAGKVTLPDGEIIIVEFQEDGLSACSECQANAKSFAKSLGKTVKLYTIDKSGQLREPFTFNP